MRTLFAAAIIAVTAAPVAAFTPVTYDAFTSFNGTNSAGGFTYGVLDDTTQAATFTPFSDAAGCAALISNTICTSNGFLPAVFKSTSGAHQSGTVIVPGDALVFHPGPNAGESAAVVFTTPVAGKYKFSLSAFVADNNPSGVTFELFVPGLTFIPVTTLSTANPSFTAPLAGYLPGGFPIGVAINFDGLYNNDSTGVNFTVTQVPEPASWALLVAGFALTGVAARRRRFAAAA